MTIGEGRYKKESRTLGWKGGNKKESRKEIVKEGHKRGKDR